MSMFGSDALRKYDEKENYSDHGFFLSFFCRQSSRAAPVSSSAPGNTRVKVEATRKLRHDTPAEWRILQSTYYRRTSKWKKIRLWLATRCPAFPAKMVEQGKQVP